MQTVRAQSSNDAIIEFENRLKTVLNISAMYNLISIVMFTKFQVTFVDPDLARNLSF